MSIRYKTNLLQHALSVRAWMAEHGGSARMDLADFRLRLRCADRERTLLPQYVGSREGKLFYSRDITPYTSGFVGWLPYAMKVWPGAGQKTAFKRGMIEAGVRTPEHWDDANDADCGFIFKKSFSSFGYGIRGPYLPAHVPLLRLTAEPGEYAERFVFGRIARAWYWDGELAVTEMFEMPTVVGDGQSTFEALLRRRIGEMTELPTQYAQVARLQGLEPGDVIARGHRVVADYRYVSPLNPTVYENSNCLPQLAGSSIAAQMQVAGKAAYALIPPETQPSTMFVLDAIVDASDQVWFLEMNSNSQVHPDLYPAMLARLFDQALPPPSAAPADAVNVAV
jgi:hypothetical protein